MASTDLNRRLTTLDASFLYTEKPNQPMHVGSVNVYEGHVSREDLVALLESRMHLLPRYRQRVVFPPFGIAHPTWEDDPLFDVRNHIEEIMLPAPGDDRALSEHGGHAFAQVLDRNRPLWKLLLLQGHESGNTHMISMVHHAMVDGVSGVELQLTMHDLTAQAEPVAPPAGAWQPRPMPDPLTLLQDAVRDLLTDAAKSWTEEAFRWWRPSELNQQIEQLTAGVTSSMPFVMQPAPRTPFNGPVSTDRGFAWIELSFPEIRAIRGALGGTVNDVVLAIFAGGLRRYLLLHDFRVDGIELRAMCPVSMRPPDQQGALGNLVSMMFAPLFVGIADPVERLAAERGAMEKLKQQGQAAGLYAMTDLTRRIPATWQAMAAQMDVPNTMINTVSTNVPGPQIPLYMQGHKLLHWYPLGPLAAGIGLFVAILSYDQKLTFGATVDPRQVPDVWRFAECLRESFEEMRAAALQAAGAEPTKAAVQPDGVATPKLARAAARAG
ncbi:MAG: WS/DGAT/MGAT family O-acyltransferase [Dehalococcoidia bacterium]